MLIIPVTLSWVSILCNPIRNLENQNSVNYHTPLLIQYFGENIVSGPSIYSSKSVTAYLAPSVYGGIHNLIDKPALLTEPVSEIRFAF